MLSAGRQSIYASLALVITALFSSADSAPGCIWITGTTKHGEWVRVSGFSPAKRLRHSIETNLGRRGAEMHAVLSGDPEFGKRNDDAVALIFLGRAAEAVEVLNKLESERPGEYFIAANLGTAYELAGNNQEALRWIKEGIRRNPDSHEGTEWLHAKILEAKIEADKDPSYFTRSSVLQLQNVKMSSRSNEVFLAGEKRRVRDIERALQYQLEERFQFVKQADPAVASLLYDYAVIERQAGVLEFARDLARMAAEFGCPAQKVQPLIAVLNWTIRVAFIAHILGYALIGALIVALVARARRRHRAWA